MSNDQQQPIEAPKKKKLVLMPVYVLVEKDSKILPSARCEFVTEDELPTEGNFYVITNQGTYLHKDTSFITANVKSEGIPFLGELQQPPRVRLPRLPSLIIARAHEFFQKVWYRDHAEAEVMLIYHPEYKQFDLWCPQQEVSGGGVWYEMSKEMEQVTKGSRSGESTGWQIVGTIHSHCNFSAYHSSVDVDDERYADGLHITLGYVDREKFGMSVSFAINGDRWQLPPENAVHGMERSNPANKFVTLGDGEFFSCKLTAEEADQFYNEYEPQIEKEWMERVHKGYGALGKRGNQAYGNQAYGNQAYGFTD